MNEHQALTILTNLANASIKNGVMNDINEAGAVYTAIIILQNKLGIQPPPEEGGEEE